MRRDSGTSMVVRGLFIFALLIDAHALLASSALFAKSIVSFLHPLPYQSNAFLWSKLRNYELCSHTLDKGQLKVGMF